MVILVGLPEKAKLVVLQGLNNRCRIALGHLDPARGIKIDRTAPEYVDNVRVLFKQVIKLADMVTYYLIDAIRRNYVQDVLCQQSRIVVKRNRS